MVVGIDAFGGSVGAVAFAALAGALIAALGVAWVHHHPPRPQWRRHAWAIGILGAGVGLAGSYLNLTPIAMGVGAGILAVAALAAPATWNDRKT